MEEYIVFSNITSNNIINNNHITFQNFHNNPLLNPKYTWINNPTTGMFNSESNIIEFNIENIPRLILKENEMLLSNLIATNLIGSGYNISNIYLSNIVNIPQLILSNVLSDVLSYYISSNTLKDQKYINSNSITDILSFLISSNILSKQNYINSNSIQDITSFLISSNSLKDQNYINSNSVQDIVDFLISSNLLSKQNYINSNSIQDVISFFITSNNLKDQNYINSNSIIDIVNFLISSNNLQDQNYINSNSIIDILNFLISSNTLYDQKYINSNSIKDNELLYISSNILSKQYYISSNFIFSYISSNNLIDQKYINSNSIQDIISFLISSNILSKQNYINSNSVQDVISFFITSNNLQDQNYINSNSIADIVNFLISSNILSKQNYINSNSIQDIFSFLISSNILSKQNYINSNSITDFLGFFISSNNLNDQNYINSNSIIDIINFYISSNNLQDQNYINSNSITDIVNFLISSNILSKQNYINSNSITDIVSFLISSNILSKQNYINSNSITDITKFLISSNILSKQNYINSNSIQDIISFLISSNNLQDQNYINSNSITDIVSFLISSNILLKQNYINSNSITDIIDFFVSSNILSKQNYINSNSITDLLGFLISSNVLQHQNYINSNSITDIISFLISSNNLQDQQYINSNSIQDIFSFLISSNNLQDQNYINSNSIKDIISFLISSNILSKQNYINSNSINDITKFIISSNILSKQNYINSNSIQDLVSFLISSNILQYQNYINSNSITDIVSFLISSNNLQDQKYINSNSIQDLVSFLISSNTLQDQNYINSNSTTDIVSFLISSNLLSKQKYINSNSISDIVSFLISSNNLQDQNYINSNSIIDIISFLISSNNLQDQNYINSNSITDIISFLISSNILSKQNYINSNSITDIYNFYVASNSVNYFILNNNFGNNTSFNNILNSYFNYVTQNTDIIVEGIHNKFIIDNIYNNNLYVDGTITASNLFVLGANTILNTTSYQTSELQIINNNPYPSLIVDQTGLSKDNLHIFNNGSNILSISSNGNVGIGIINPTNALEVNGDIIASNIIGSGSNVTNINWCNLINVPLYFITSNILQSQLYINSNSVNDIISFYVGSNVISSVMLNDGFINSNNIFTLTSNLGFDTITQRNAAIKSLTYNYPLYKTSSSTILNYNPYHMMLNSNNALTLSSNVKVVDNTLTFKFNLLQGNITYPFLWYYQFKIKDYSKCYLIDGKEYNVFTLTSWSGNNVDVLYNSFITITNNKKEIVNNNIVNNNIIIDLGDGTLTTEGWQLDNDTEYMTWFSTTPKTIYNILVDQINSSSNITNYNYIDSNILSLQNYINSNYLFNNITSLITCNVLKDILLPYYNILNNTTDNINNGVVNKFIVNKIYDNNLNINGTITASNLYVLGTNTVFANNFTNPINNLSIENFNTGTALTVEQKTPNIDIAHFYNNNDIILSITGNSNIGIKTLNPNYKLEVIGTVNTTEIYGIGSNISNIIWSNIINIDPKYVYSNSLINNLSFIVTSNDLLNYLKQGYINDINIISNLNANYGFDTVNQMNSDINYLNNKVNFINNDILSNVIYYNNILQNNYGLIEDNSYSLSNVNFTIKNKNTYFYFNSNIYLPNSIIQGNYNVDFFNGKNIIYNYKTTNINYSTVYPIIYDTDNTVLNPIVFYQFDGSLNDISGNNNNLIGYNNIGFSSNSIYGLSLKFNTSNFNYAKIISSNNINISAIQNSYGYTISFWVLITPNAGNGSTIFEIRDNTYPLNYLYINSYNGILRFGANLDPIFAKVGMFSEFGNPYWIYYDTLYNVKNYIDYKYHHIIWQIDNSGAWNIWIDNNQLVGNNIPSQGFNVLTTYGTNYSFPTIAYYNSIIGFELPLNTNTTYSYTFGNNYYLNNSGGYFDGNIVDFRIYTSIITSNQITTLYNNPISYSTYNSYLTTSLIGWYKFQNNLNDSSGNNNNITGIGTIRYNSTGGIINGPICLYLNKDIWTNDNYISIPPSIINLPNIQRTTGITISFWVSTNQWQRSIIEMSTDFIMVTDYNYSNAYYARFVFKNNTISLPLTSINFLDGNYHHICYTVDNTGTWNLWMDNIKLIGNGGILGNVTSLNLTTNSYFYIGKSIGYGNISDLRIYPLVLSDDYIYKLHYYIEYNSPLTITSTLATRNRYINYVDSSYPILFDYNNIIIQPLLWLKFDNIPPAYLYNVSIDDSSIYNTQTAVNVSKLHFSNFGVKGNNSFFLYNNRYITYNTISLSYISFSISFWSFIWTISPINIIVIGNINNSYQRITFGINATNNYVFDFTNDGFYSSATCTNDYHKWVHLTITYNANTNIRKIYKNGVLIGYNIANGVPYPTSILEIGIDRIAGTYWKGAIDDFRIYKTELPEYQVKNLYTGKINFYHYANDGPLYTNTLTNNIGINTKNPPNTLQVNGTIKADEFSGSGSNITNINWSNIINIPISVQNIINSITISSNVLFNQPYANNFNVSANYVSSNYFTTMNYINSNNIASLINTYNTIILNTNYITSNSLNSYVNNNSISSLLLQNNYNSITDNYYISNINFVVNKNNNTYNSNSSFMTLNNTSYLYFNNNPLDVTNIINYGLYKVKYDNGKSIIYYNTYSNIMPYLTDTILELTTNNILSTTDRNYSNIYDSSNNIIYPRTWFKFDNNNVITYDSTPYSHATISITNSSFSSNSIKGYTSLYLGSSSYGILWRGYALDTSSFSVMFWIYQPRTNLVFSCLSSQNTTVMGTTANSYYFTVNSGYGRTTTSYPLLQNDIGKWVHMTYVFDNDLKYGYIYRNGSNIAKMYMPITTLIDDLLYLGGTSPSSCLFNLDDYRLYSNVVLTSNQILSCINATYYDSSTDIFITSNNSYPNAYNGITSNIINPLSWYKFEDLNNLQLYNNPSLSINSVKGNKCLLLNGTDQYLTDTLSYNLYNNDFSICFWIKPLTNSDMYIYTFANSYFGINNNKYYLNFNGTIITTYDITNDINQWIYIIISYNVASNTIIIYRNSISIISSNPSTSITNNNILTIGNNNNYYWNGYIDDFRIYNITLSTTQIKELYSGRITYYHYYNNGPLFINNITNNIGINTPNPRYTLDILGNTKATEFIGIGSNLTNIKWSNILFPSYIKNNIITSNDLNQQNYINSNSIQDLLNFYISSNTLNKQKYINSNSIQDLISYYISSNNLQNQNYINSNSIQDLLNFYISSKILKDQNYINSNSISDIVSFLISSNTLQDQNYINSNSIEDLLTFYISSNILKYQNYINSNSISDIVSFLISSNTLQDQNYINSNSIEDLLTFYISSNNLQDQKYINSNSIEKLLSFYISSNNLQDQKYINSNSIEDLLTFYISSNILKDQNYINSNSIENLLEYLISSNQLNYIYSSNSIIDILSFYISSNNLYDQNYINSNSIINLLSFYISSNNLQDQNYINSNSIEDLLAFYISSNTLKNQNYINSNSIQNITEFYISSNILKDQNYINSNSIQDITSFYVSSNTIINNNFVDIITTNNVIGYLSNLLTTINNKIDVINMKLYNNNIF